MISLRVEPAGVVVRLHAADAAAVVRELNALHDTGTLIVGGKLVELLKRMAAHVDDVPTRTR